jgi:hypothetical protein
VARTRAASLRHGGPEDSELPPPATPAADGTEEEPTLAKVIPMPIFDPFAEADKPW